MTRANISDFDPPRRFKRFVPSKPLTVAVLNQGLPMTYGVVANISERGVCVESGKFSTKKAVDLVLSFSDGEMIEATARVIWEEARNPAGQAVYGLEITDLSASSKANLSAALESDAFRPAN